MGEVYDAERDKIFEEEIVVAGEEAALAEFDEFLRIEMNNGNGPEKNNVDEEAERLEVALLGKEAALKEYKLLREEREQKIREARLKAEEEAEAARKLAEEEARRAEEERLRAEEEERLRRGEEEERQRREEEERLRREEEERLRKEEEERLRMEREERLRREEEERLKREEEERIAAAAALKEIQERLERQKAAAEARRQ